jgi:hypothetical protein
MDYIKNQAQEIADSNAVHARLFKTLLNAVEIDLTDGLCVFGDDHSEGECASCENVRFGGSY